MKGATFYLCLLLFLLVACTRANNPGAFSGELIQVETASGAAETGTQEQTIQAVFDRDFLIQPILQGETSTRFPQYDPIEADDFILQLNGILYEKAYELLDTVGSQPTTYLCDYRTTYQSALLTSFRYEYYTYQFPAAHGLSACSGVTIDWEREEILPLRAFFCEHPIWKEIVNDRMRDYLFQEEIALFDIAAFEGVTKAQTFYLTETAFVLVFPPYLYTPGVLGVLEIPVAFTDVATYLREAYLPILLPETDLTENETGESDG